MRTSRGERLLLETDDAASASDSLVYDAKRISDTEGQIRARRSALAQRRQTNRALKMRLLNQLPVDGSSRWSTSPHNKLARENLLSAGKFAAAHGESDLEQMEEDYAESAGDSGERRRRLAQLDARRRELLAAYDDRWEDDFVYDEELSEGDDDFAFL